MLLVTLAFIVLLLTGMPVAFAIGISGFLFFLQNPNLPITIPIQLHAVNLNMPVGTPPPPTEPPQVVTIDVDFDGTIYWNGDMVANKAALEAKMIDAAARPIQPEIHLRPNKLAEYKDVAAVMASAQRLGVVKLGLIGNEQFVK